MVGAVALTSLAVVSPAGATGSGDFTGDITPPTIVSFSVSPASVDVTNSNASFTVTVHATDDLSGVDSVNLTWASPSSSTMGGVGYPTLVSGDHSDGTYSGTFVIPRYSPSGDYPMRVSVRDRAHNESYADEGPIHVVDSNPDNTPPTLTSLHFTPSTIDVRGGPQPVKIDATVTDAQSGSAVMSVFLTVFNTATQAATSGGSNPPQMVLVSGDSNDGTYSGTATIPQYTRSGRWSAEVTVSDLLGNYTKYDAQSLQGQGLESGFDVVSNEDTDAPHAPDISIEPAEVDVHDSDQPIHFRVHVTDDLAGVRPSQVAGTFVVEADAIDPVFHQSESAGYMPRTSGDDLDGVYEGTMTIPRHSATGLRPVRVYTEDGVANYRYIQNADLVAAGAVPAILVYNVPLPPLPVSVDPGDGTVTVHWDAPTSDEGSPVTGYVIRETPEGKVLQTLADARAATVGGLTNGVPHQFTIEAVNKAGASDPSAPLATVPNPQRSGYWMVDKAGTVYAFGDAAWMGNADVGRSTAAKVEPTPSRNGYWVLDRAGDVFTFGDAPYLGGAGHLATGEEATSISSTPSGLGYWLFTNRGRVMPFGDAQSFGDLAAVHLNGPVLGSVATPSGRGYYMVASDGGVFAFGDAQFHGSMGGIHLNAPVESLVPTASGAGYWLVASDGGIFAFDAPFYGSMGSVRLNKPVSGMVGSPTGNGYLMVAEDGGIFTFGDVPFRGSLGDHPPAVPVVAVAPCL
jgi:hypothetical protein